MLWHTKTGRLALSAVFLALAMIVSYIESMMTFSPFPGVKLGLSNVVIMFLFFRVGKTEAISVSVVRVILISILFGNLASFVFSAAGGALSLASMFVSLTFKDKISFFGIGVLSSSIHGVGQIIGFAALYSAPGAVMYLPVLLLTSVPLGLLSGGLIVLLDKKIKLAGE